MDLAIFGIISPGDQMKMQEKKIKLPAQNEQEKTSKEKKVSKPKDYSHISKKRTCFDLLRLSAAAMGIELAYSAETAFVSPILLELGMEHQKMTLVWALSPVLGFFLSPLLGSLSDRCGLKLGRRRPIIILLSLGLLFGLFFVPYGKDIGLLMGDEMEAFKNSSAFQELYEMKRLNLSNSNIEERLNTIQDNNLPIKAVVVTILGIVLMDFNADVCQGPVRAYLLDISLPEDHARGLSSFTVMAGIGGFLGYAIGGVDWNNLMIGTWMGGNVKTVFMIVTIIFVLCVIITITSFREVPLKLLEQNIQINPPKSLKSSEDIKTISIKEPNISIIITNEDVKKPVKQFDDEEKVTRISLWQYLKTVVMMPRCMKILYLNNVLNWMSHLSYTLYYTDFVGESVYGGDPGAPVDSPELNLYNEGVRFGCWGLAVYSISCAMYSSIIEWLIKKFGAKSVLVGGFSMYAISMCLMAYLSTPLSSLLLNIPAGIAYSTLTTIPYIMVAHYHTERIFESCHTPQVRGLGTDVAVIGSTVFVAQLSLSLGLSSASHWLGGATSAMWASGALAGLAALTAMAITYLDL